MPSPKPLPLIDIFAGPGGLGEGFASFRVGKRRAYRPALSIEKDPAAHRTLKLRAFFRQFPDGKAPNDYYATLRGELELETLYANHPDQHAVADHEAWCAELGQSQIKDVRARIRQALGDTPHHPTPPTQPPWVLLGGPPCQPFSLAGRSRNAPGTDTQYSDGKDTRHELYLEYLQIIADFWPAVFVMENVRGLLSAKYNGQGMFDRIHADLRDPTATIDAIPGRTRYRKTKQPAHRYILYALNPTSPSGSQCNKTLYDGGLDADTEPDFLVRCEQYGIPQARHRLVLLGVREDINVADLPPKKLKPQPTVPARSVLDDLPPLRGGLSKADSPERRKQTLLQARDSRWLQQLKQHDRATGAAIEHALAHLPHLHRQSQSTILVPWPSDVTGPEPKLFWRFASTATRRLANYTQATLTSSNLRSA